MSKPALPWIESVKMTPDGHWLDVWIAGSGPMPPGWAGRAEAERLQPLVEAADGLPKDVMVIIDRGPADPNKEYEVIETYQVETLGPPIALLAPGLDHPALGPEQN